MCKNINILRQNPANPLCFKFVITRGLIDFVKVPVCVYVFLFMLKVYIYRKLLCRRNFQIALIRSVCIAGSPAASSNVINSFFIFVFSPIFILIIYVEFAFANVAY